MEPDTTYTATLTMTSGHGRAGTTRIEYTWDPPLLEVVEEFGEDDLPAAYGLMGYTLEKAVFPAVALNRNYEALILDDPDAEEELNS